MPTFDDATTSDAPIEDVWKLLYDPARFPDWWAGIESSVPSGPDGQGDVTLYPDGYPDFPMPQELRTDGDGHTVVVSCLVSDLIFAWKLEPITESDGTHIAVHVEIPEHEARRLDATRNAMSESLRCLATLAAMPAFQATDGPPG